MPNYCTNTLVLEATHEELNKFYIENKLVDTVKNEYSYLSFAKSVPQPENNNDWYNWNINNWGTKWDTCECECDQVDSVFENLGTDFTNLTYHFDTAWGPPSNWLERVAEKYKNIHFDLEYSEPGMDFWGKKEYDNGSFISSEEMPLGEHNWSFVDEDILKNIIGKYTNEINEENIHEMTEEIFEEYVNEDQYLENIHGFIENLLQELIDEKPKIDESTIFKLNYDNDGNVINQLEF